MEAREFAGILTHHQIEFRFEDQAASFDPTFANNEINREYRIKLRKTDFKKADELLDTMTERLLNSVSPAYYLFEFTDEELFEIVQKPDEWSRYDFLLAQRILNERGLAITPSEIELLRERRLQELSRPENSSQTWILFGYLFALLGGIFGILIGWHILAHKKTLPDGKQVPGYSVSDRKHGSWIALLGAISLLIWLSIRLRLMDT